MHLSRDDENDAVDRSSEAEAEGRVPRTWDELSGKEQRVRGLRLRNAAEQGLVGAPPFPPALLERIHLYNEVVHLDWRLRSPIFQTLCSDLVERHFPSFHPMASKDSHPGAAIHASITATT